MQQEALMRRARLEHGNTFMQAMSAQHGIMAFTPTGGKHCGMR
jgi:hypothetical protein